MYRKWSLCYLRVRMQTSTFIMENYTADPLWSSNPTSGYLPKRSEIGLEKIGFIPTFTAAPFTISMWWDSLTVVPGNLVLWNWRMKVTDNEMTKSRDLLSREEKRRKGPILEGSQKSWTTYDGVLQLHPFTCKWQNFVSFTCGK
jgi:hypothetical protein